jgi:DNA-binding MarR family transcriptional regulator
MAYPLGAVVTFDPERLIMTSPHKPLPELDFLIHEAARLRIIAVLNECDQAEFMFLLGTTGLTRGNLSTHLARLVDAGYVQEEKHFLDRKPCSTYRMCEKGIKAYAQYLDSWRRITRARKS